MSASPLIDYLAFTIVRTKAAHEFMGQLGLPAGCMDHCLRFRSNQLGIRVQGTIAQFASGRENALHVEITGSGCRRLEREGVVLDWRSLLHDLRGRQAKFKRIDVAIDDRQGTLPMDEVVACVKRQELSSRTQSRRVTENCNTSGRGGATVYIGSSKSDVQVRIYDKAAERGLWTHWVRVELQVRGVAAENLAQSLVTDGLDVVASYLKDFVDFKHPGEGKQKCRWRSREWWPRFLGECSKLRLMTGKSTTSGSNRSTPRQSDQFPTFLLVWARQVGTECLLALADQVRRDQNQSGDSSSGRSESKSLSPQRDDHHAFPDIEEDHSADEHDDLTKLAPMGPVASKRCPVRMPLQLGMEPKRDHHGPPLPPVFKNLARKWQARATIRTISVLKARVGGGQGGIVAKLGGDRGRNVAIIRHGATSHTDRSWDCRGKRKPPQLGGSRGPPTRRSGGAICEFGTPTGRQVFR